MAISIDLVADLGESFGAWTMGDDEALLDVLTSANIACGFHAGDPRTMDTTVRRCVERGIGIGAHPSFPDLAGFGRRAMDLTPDEVRTDMLYQIGALKPSPRHTEPPSCTLLLMDDSATWSLLAVTTRSRSSTPWPRSIPRWSCWPRTVT